MELPNAIVMHDVQFHPPAARRNGNVGGYQGDGLEVDFLLGQIVDVARAGGWELERLPVGSGDDLLMLTRPVPGATRRIYVSAGIHGDEPAGPLAVLELLRRGRWPKELEVRLAPCLNAAGFRLKRRENGDGLDLNRDYRDRRSSEVRAHVAWLERQPSFDLTLCLHEDWEAAGFYVYELNRDGGRWLGESIVNAVSKVCPIDGAERIDGWPAVRGIIRPEFKPMERPDWPEAYYLVSSKTRHSCTLEAPSDYPMALRVAALVTGVEAALASESSALVRGTNARGE